MSSEGVFLFSLDLEDIRLRQPDGAAKPARVAVNTRRYLQFLKEHQANCTFFVVGELAQAEPELVAQILEEGHEIACHGQCHTPLDQLTADGFRRDLEKNLQSLRRAGAEEVVGFRAPCFSLTPKTAWAYEILQEFGIVYSSSVLPAQNPIYGWPGFGEHPRAIGRLWEIPITLAPIPGLRVPHSGGVYFRALPGPLVQVAFAYSMRKLGFVTGYFHPYDVDSDEVRSYLPELGPSRFFQWLFYYNRRGVFGRLERLMSKGVRIFKYRDFVASRG